MTTGRITRQQLAIPDLPDSTDQFSLTGEYVPSLRHLSAPDHVDRDAASGCGMMHVGQTIHGVVLFADVGAFTDRTSELEPKEVAYWSNKFFQLTWPCCEKHHATVDKVIGDALMLVFAPKLGCERPIESAINVALSMLRWDTHMHWPHIGLAYGPIWLGYSGPPCRMGLSVFGSTVNLASRMGSLAESFEIAMPAGNWKTAKDNIDLNQFDEHEPDDATERFYVKEERRELKGVGCQKVTIIGTDFRSIHGDFMGLPPLTLEEQPESDD